jgi:glycerophosphoryl diester phosphodiesterase
VNKKIFGLAIVCGGVMLTCFTCSLTYFVTKKTKIYDAFHAAKNTPIIAHRGYASQYMANTTEAFLAAATSKLFNGIETDI